MTAVLYGALLVLGMVLLAVTAVRVLVGGLDPGWGQPVGKDRAGRALEERYAAGELSTEEYRHRLRTRGERRP